MVNLAAFDSNLMQFDRCCGVKATTTTFGREVGRAIRNSLSTQMSEKKTSEKWKAFWKTEKRRKILRKLSFKTERKMMNDSVVEAYEKTVDEKLEKLEK